MGEIDKKHINEFIKGQMTEYIYIALSDLVQLQELLLPRFLCLSLLHGGSVAQSVSRLARKQKVESSNPRGA